MQDRVYLLLIIVPVVFIILILATMLFVTSMNGGPSNPIASIPKVIFDNKDGETRVTVMGVGEQRYDAIYINYTVGNETFSVQGLNRYALDANISDVSFVLNITAISEEDHYMLNCTVKIEQVPPDTTYIWIQEEEETSLSRHRSPYTILAEWREIE